MPDEAKLNANQKRAIPALLSHSTVGQAAKSVGLSKRTLQRYLSDDTFRRELRRRQDGIVTSVTAALVGQAGEAVKTLRDLLRDPDASGAVRCRAALGWLAQMRQSVELADLAERVSKLEEVMHK